MSDPKEVIGSDIAVVLFTEKEGDDDAFVFAGLLKDEGHEDFLAVDRGPDHPPFPFPREWCDSIRLATDEQAEVFGARYFVVRVVGNLPDDADKPDLIPTGINLSSVLE
ncbi:MAG: hypothetical protein HY825_06870 [Acidobacteria bacterium]|nr:hypothetical protein [Acidobacteriota bacterium]